MIPDWKIYPRSQGKTTVYLNKVINDPSIEVGEYTTYDDFVNDPEIFNGTTSFTIIRNATMTG